RDGAKLIYDKALVRFPDDWNLSYQAAYHYLFEMQDSRKAADLLVKASESPRAPFFLRGLAARLYALDGQALMGISVLREYLDRNPVGDGAKHARKRLRELEAALAKNKRAHSSKGP